MSPEQRARLIEIVSARVAERLSASSATPAAPAQSSGGYDDPPSASAASASSRVALVPCAIPPPGTPRYQMALGISAKPACADLAHYIDHTILKAEATEAEVAALCKEAAKHEFASVCVNSSWVPLARRMLAGTPVLVCTVVGFPLGAMSTEAKAFETRDAAANGAEEIDMVVHVGRLKARDFDYVRRDIAAVVAAAQGRTVKVILETALLTDEEKIAACELSREAGADFVKTSTGFSKGGATEADIALMRSVVGKEMGVKASGGIRDCAVAQSMIAAGASRIGASSSVKIVGS